MFRSRDTILADKMVAFVLRSCAHSVHTTVFLQCCTIHVYVAYTLSHRIRPYYQ